MLSEELIYAPHDTGRIAADDRIVGELALDDRPSPDNAVIPDGCSRENHGVGANEAITPNEDGLNEFTMPVSARK